MNETLESELGFRVCREWLVVKMKFFRDPRATSKELLEFVHALGAARKGAASLLIELGETDADFWIFNLVAACELDGMQVFASAPPDSVIRKLFESTGSLVDHCLSWIDDLDAFTREKGLQLPPHKTLD